MGPRCEGNRSRSSEPTVGVRAAETPWPAPRGNKTGVFDERSHVPAAKGRVSPRPTRPAVARNRRRADPSDIASAMNGTTRNEVCFVARANPPTSPAPLVSPRSASTAVARSSAEHGDIDAAGREE